VAVLAATVEISEIVEKLNLLLHNTVLYERLKANCLPAREIFNWQNEEKKLLQFYRRNSLTTKD
jgi:glycosyltransferase involved in cell wall biosynthesis